ncbi:unnamed protein product [Phytophthora fragariaefolia]|uniref:RxLR effector protein n=1 Tax=Phytophthora fragariaefolia TaxID=1490495 RepID=A0A9W6XAA4_9STRA|nr:unnamed protein product [Phytophthora fragariaefolia]
MRTYRVVLTATAILLITSGAAHAKTTPNVRLSDPSIPVDKIVPTSDTEDRFLRIRESNIDDLENEERCAEGVANLASKAKQSASDLLKVDDTVNDAIALIKHGGTVENVLAVLNRGAKADDSLLAQSTRVESKINHFKNQQFKAVHDAGFSPKTLYKKLNLAKETHGMVAKLLTKNGDFMFWVHYTRWYAENVAKNVAKNVA